MQLAAMDTLGAARPASRQQASQQAKKSSPRSDKPQVSRNLQVMASVTPSIFPTANTSSPSK